MAAPPDPSPDPSYTPAPNLSNNPFLTTSQLVTYFQDFYASLKHVSCSPGLIFDRLVTNLNEVFASTLEQERLHHAMALERERLQHVAALEKCNHENKTLKSANDQLQAELAKLGEVITKLTGKTKVESSPVIGTFYTHEVRSPLKAKIADQASRIVHLASPPPAPLALSIGLNMLDVPKNQVIRVKAYANNIQKGNFHINLDTYNSSVLRSGGCTWLEAGADSGFQFGTYSTGEDYHWQDPKTLSQRWITFPCAYSTPPKVVVWLTSLDMPSGDNWRVKTYETNVTTTGFNIHIDTWDGSVIFYTTASWVAYPADKPNVFSGRFSTESVRSSSCPQLYNSGYVSFGNTFASPPRTILAINSIDISCKQDLRFAVKASDISAVGMTWHLDSWDNTILNSAGASYIALG